MSVGHLHTTLLSDLAADYAHLSAQAAAVGTLTTGRLLGTAASLVALAGVVIGGLALSRAARGTGTPRRGAVLALAAGLTGMAVGGFVVAAAEGGPGTGYGIVGGFAALGIGLIAGTLGGLAVVRSRRTG